MSEYFGGVEALSGGLANQEQLRRNAMRKLEAEGKIEKGSLEREMASIDHDGEAARKKTKKEVGRVEVTREEYQSGKDSGEGSTATTVYEAPPTYTLKENGSEGDEKTSTGVKGAVRKLFKR
ncbi:hypothetical protein G6011_02840 [Alternaria panax]|uniref:Uncharacterized protein n=1 Tax=Alternaria panax TaxID=48097 RepID=A0AAD4I822_9PLEO|nr:hypothetical protein G6011_02840 [Alternaria panax]